MTEPLPMLKGCDPSREVADLFADGDLHFQLARILKTHWLFDLGCDGKSNQAACACGFPDFPRVANVGEAVDTFVNHVLEEMRPYLAAWNTRATDPAKLEMLVEALKGIKARHGWCAHPCKACEAADAALTGAAR